jgi:HD-GYP domain-containing protein (c-di-GMP phosphodiesterase class II)
MITDLSLQNLPNADQRLEALFQAFDDLLFILSSEGTILDYKARDEMQLFTVPAQFMQRKMQDVLPAEVGHMFENALLSLKRDKKVIQMEYSLPTPSGAGWFEARLVPLPSGQVAAFVRDITRYKQSEFRIKNQLEQLEAVRSIDRAIASGVDLHLTLSVLLDHVRTQLSMDAASILLLNSRTQQLEFAAGLGFTTDALRHTRLRYGEGYAGLAILTGESLHIANLRTANHVDQFRSPAFSRENFVAYYAVPLIAKGETLGVLEIFHRTPAQAGVDSLVFMNMLADQAAIAIENAMLIKSLQSTHTELAATYDATIEGWARALQLRDKETEIHTRRVTEMTLRLARLLGLPEADLLHMKRGAILHDIGKVAIPDSILHKPGPLNDGEWKLMRKHPLIAVELLEPVPYLGPALAIPRSHHEKWDGSGYPYGLTGEQIPIAARIFALADVYDALTSDRPYRPAWTNSQTLAYVRSQAGLYFDPGLVAPFIEMLALPPLDWAG